MSYLFIFLFWEADASALLPLNANKGLPMSTTGVCQLWAVEVAFWGQRSQAKEEKQLSVPKPHWELIQLKAGLTSI